MTITVQQADTLIQAHADDTNFVIIDVRTAAEYNSGYIVGAMNMNYYGSTFTSDLDTLDHNKIYLIYCQSGSRSGQTFIQMQNKNFVTVYNMQGGMNSWLSAGYPTSTTTAIVNSSELTSTVTIYPNPVSGISTLEISGKFSSACNIEIYDICGRLYKTVPIITKITLSHDEFQPGIYIYRTINEKNESVTGKFAVE